MNFKRTLILLTTSILLFSSSLTWAADATPEKSDGGENISHSVRALDIEFQRIAAKAVVFKIEDIDKTVAQILANELGLASTLVLTKEDEQGRINCFLVTSKKHETRVLARVAGFSPRLDPIKLGPNLTGKGLKDILASATIVDPNVIREVGSFSVKRRVPKIPQGEMLEMLIQDRPKPRK